MNKSGVLLDNKYVVPYNPYISKRYNVHINVEISSSVQSCKYLYKYVYKSPDMASVGVEPHDKHDEIKKFVKVHNCIRIHVEILLLWCPWKRSKC